MGYMLKAECLIRKENQLLIKRQVPPDRSQNSVTEENPPIHLA